jgi:NAD(P)-dependent dehydrogenase (short-subunit alcohol dehydrogenase family)
VEPAASCVLDRSPGDPPRAVLVVGASGGIGTALCAELQDRYPGITIVRMARQIGKLPPLRCECHDIAVDIGNEPSIERAVAAIPTGLSIDWVLIATGWLHDGNRQPEKTFRSLQADQLLHAYTVNAVGPTLLVKHLLQRCPAIRHGRIGILSARVGSVSDNRLGGWHSYRASKAALNMLIKNYAIELGRRNRDFIIVGLQPGTTDTRLSAPFQRNVPAEQLQSPAFTAKRLVAVMQRLTATDSGRLFDFEGLEFDP